METDQSALKKEKNLLSSIQTAQKSTKDLNSHSFSALSISEAIKETEKVDAFQILSENTKIEINKAFQKEFEQSLNKGFPLDMLINETIITLNPDNSYSVRPNEKREINTVVKGAIESGDAVYVRGFGSFVNKKIAQKVARNISKNTTIIIEADQVPSFKPIKGFVEEVKTKTKGK